MDPALVTKITIFVGFIFCVVIHECAHALVASWRGDDTARMLGRLTLNPIPHIDPFMTILLPGMLLLSGLPAFGGARPVPVNIFNLRHPVRDMLWVAIAGPISNVLLALGFAVLLNLTPVLLDADPKVGKFFVMVFLNLVAINILLAVFNMIPIPPLDGSRVLAAFLPERHALSVHDYRVQTLGMFAVCVLVLTGGTDLLWPITDRVTMEFVRWTAFGRWGDYWGF